MTAGLTAGSVAAIVAALVSLPLRSPSDTLLNSAAVALAGLLSGVAAGLLWLAVRRSPKSHIYFLAIWAAAFIPATLLVILWGRLQLDNFTAFALPLAVIVFVITGFLTPAIPRFLPWLHWWGAAIAIAAAVTVGLGLAGQGDQESGELRLPPPSARLAPALPAHLLGDELEVFASPSPVGRGQG